MESSLINQDVLRQQRKFLDVHLNNWGKQRKPVPADGHCILHAFSLGLREIEDHSDYRVASLLPKIREELLRNIEFYAPFVGNLDVVAELDSYVISKSYDSGVVDLMLYVLANATQTSILVFYPLEDNVRTLLIPPSNATARRTIYISKIGQHYDAILDKENSSRLKIEGKFSRIFFRTISLDKSSIRDNLKKM